MEPSHKTIAQTILSRNTDWRFPDEEGLSQRTLDCRQLCMMEVLKWKGVSRLTPIFLNAFDCESSGMLLRRQEPQLNLGWKLTRYSPLNPEGLFPLIQSILDHEGYVLLFYKAHEAPFSGYYEKHDIVHWSLLTGCDEQGVDLVDDEGAPAYFNGYIGRVPREVLLDTLGASGFGGAAIIKEDPAYTRSWEEDFRSLVQMSVDNMINREGLKNLESFVQAVETAPLEELIGNLERLEFDIHYYRRLRELWKTAVEKQVVPEECVAPGWVEELLYVCKSWSLVMGVLAKWKRQPQRDYRLKLTDYLNQTLESERGFFRELKRIL
ncbi:hypothetical protein [Paenibacillus sp. FJAT-26967]|uniref:hypothetical protein n=1 Tax=Paenibacillus sp. FJAT-26967 TaxID=1729690 RepID=UPI000838B219|nr:hypothetical protein [Paenibacillus sp. FJAT-26967]